MIGLVFAGYVVGHRSTSASGSSRIRASGGALDIQQILKTVQPSVVSILTGHTTTIFDSAGSGVVISEDGLILTNNHVIEGATQITVKPGHGDARRLVGGQRHRSDQGEAEWHRAGQARLV